MEKIIPEIALQLPSEGEMTKISERWWNQVRDTTFAEWNDELKALSYPMEIIKIPKDLVNKMLHLTDSQEDYKKDSPAVLATLEALLGPAIAKFGTPFFAKLITRAPKDVMYDDSNHGKPRSFPFVKMVLGAFLNSTRTFDDLVLFSHIDECAIVIRPYVNFNPLDEWRVMVQDRKIVGISQYYYNSEWDQHMPLEFIDKTIREFIDNQVTPHMKPNSFIADVVLEHRRYKAPLDRSFSYHAVLLETNPWGLSDPCLFQSYDNLDGRLLVNDGTVELPDYSNVIEI